MDDEDRRAIERREDAALVERARADDPDAFGLLYDRWFARVHDLAMRVSGDAAAAGDVAQEAFLAAWQKLDTLRDPEAFGGWLLRITRNGALDRRRKDERARPYDSEGMAVIEAGGSPADAPTGFRVEDRATAVDDPARAAEDGELVSLVWDSAAALGERDAEVLDLMLRHGLAPAEIGEVVGLNRNAANQAVHRARNRLKTAIEARVLWRSGEPVCALLASTLESGGVAHFGPEAVRAITKHADTCVECAARRETRLEPSRLFAAAPIIGGSIILRSKVAHALSEAGVPMDGSDVAPPGEDGADDGDGSGHGPHRGLRRAATALALTLVVIVLIAFLAEDVGEIRLTSPTADKTTTTTLATTSTAVTLPTDLGTVPTAPTTAARTAPPVTQPPVALPPPPPPPAASASISVSPGAAPRSYTLGLVTVSWSTANAVSVNVSGPGLGSSSFSSSAPVCPGQIEAGSICRANPGVHTYVITAVGAGGDVVTRTATLAIR